jgi:hypothetical protein
MYVTAECTKLSTDGSVHSTENAQLGTQNIQLNTQNMHLGPQADAPIAYLGSSAKC